MRRIGWVLIPLLLVALGYLMGRLDPFGKRAEPPMMPLTTKERIALVKCLIDLSDMAATVPTIPVLDRWVKEDPDPDVRYKARGLIALRHENKACPTVRGGSPA